ncbi:centrosomal protein of 164 kDa isoform X2 [Protopterus annectens]|uniref:centrosomal protein of 164 kDa isoform X2 n=1 Tax=Protopterus annectens TaxID=7888 RepID=UPI001CFBEB7B|nr:centrosomal protein of 164 kDa isoform X2 [Protopterus annectens]
MAVAAMRIGDQLILEESYDESYIPNEQEIQEYAREIGIDPVNEPELMWLAREGVVAPLPEEWKPCQDVTGDIYYFNFATGQSSWDHPCDEHYRKLVIQEREKLQMQGPSKKKHDKKKKKEKKEKKEKEKKEKEHVSSPKVLNSSLAPVQAPLGGLSPLRGLADSSGNALRGSLGSMGGSSMGLEPLKASPTGVAGTSVVTRTGGNTASLLGFRNEERVSLTLPGIEDDEDEIENKNQSPFGSARVMKNVHMDLESLGGGFDYEESDRMDVASCDSHHTDMTEPELENLKKSEDEAESFQEMKSESFNANMDAGDKLSRNSSIHGVTPSTPDQIRFETDADSNMHELSEEYCRAVQRVETLNLQADIQKEIEFQDDTYEETEKTSLAEDGKAVDKKKDCNSTQAAMNGTEHSERETADEVFLSVNQKASEGNCDNFEVKNPKNETEEELNDELRQESEPSEQIKELQVLSHSDDEIVKDVDFGFRSRVSEQIMDVDALSPVPEIQKPEIPKTDEKDELKQKQSTEEQERQKRAEAAESEKSDFTPPSDKLEVLGLLLDHDKQEDVEFSEEDRSAVPSSPQHEQSPTPSEEGRIKFEMQQKEMIQEHSHKLIEKLPTTTEQGMEDEMQQLKQEVESKKIMLEHEVECEKKQLQQEVECEKQQLQQEIENEKKRLEEEMESEKKRLQQEVDNEKKQLYQQKEENLRRLKEDLRQKEEEEAQHLYQEKENKLRYLTEKLRIEREVEEAQLGEEQKEKLQKLRAQIKQEMESEEQKIRQEKGASLQEVQNQLELLKASEEKSFEDKRRELADRMKEETEEALREEKIQLEAEKERALQELRQELDKVKKKALQELETLHEVELQQLRNMSEEKHQKVLAGLKKQIAEAHSSEAAHPEVDVKKVQQKIQQVSGYERELSDLLKEKRREVEKDHERKLERLEAEHRDTAERIRLEYEEEERKQRERLLHNLREEKVRLTRVHEQQLAELRQNLEQRLHELQRHHKEKEANIQDLEEKLELKAKELTARNAYLNKQEEVFRKKAEQLFEEQDQRVERKKDENLTAVSSKWELQELKQEHHNLQDSIKQSRVNLDELWGQKSELESQVELLQNKSQRLQTRISELEVVLNKKQETMKNISANGNTVSDEDEELHVEDLRNTPKLSFQKKNPRSRTEEAEAVNIDDIRHYVSSEGVSIKKVKEFLERQTRSLRKRQTALKAAKQEWRHNMQKAQDDLQDSESSQILEDARKNLDEEAKHLDEMQSTVRKGRVLLKKKEERLSQLESSLQEEISEEDTLKGVGTKHVTFNLSDSDETSSIISEDLPQRFGVDLKYELPLTQPAKAHYLTESLQRITSELNNVLTVLGTMGGQPSPAVFNTSPSVSNSIPLPPYSSLARSHTPSATAPLPNQWAWSPGKNLNFTASASQSVDDILMEKWHKYFPGGIPSLSGNRAPLDGRFGYMSAGDQMRVFQHTRAPEIEKTSIKGMIEANRKWLQNFKNDPKIPLFSRMSKTSNHGLVQLGLDENNQIKADSSLHIP